MIKRITLVGSILAVAGLSFLNSCKDDEETPITGIQFEIEEQEVTESDGTLVSFHPDLADAGEGRIINIKMVFDRTLAGDAVIEFDIDGSASESASGFDVNDFEVVEEGEKVSIDGNKITILNGATEASFSIRVFEDFDFEYDQNSLNDDGIPFETIELTLESVVSGPVKLGETLEHVLKILEDDTFVFLSWNPADQEGTVGDVNMDLFIYIDGELGAYSTATNDEYEYESMVIPAGFPDGTFGFSYVYKSGTSTDVDFEAEIANFGGTLTKSSGGSPGAVFTFQGKYDLDNLNPYEDPENSNSKIVQTMVKTGLNYTGVSDITAPETGSRLNAKPSMLNQEIFKKKIKAFNNNNFVKMIQSKK